MKNKIESLAVTFDDTGASFSILSETWIDKDNEDRIKNDLKKGFALDIISKARKTKKGGGVAIVYKESKIAFKKHSFFTGNYEVVAAKGCVKGIRNAVFVFALYYPPDMKSDDVEKLNSMVNDEIEKIKMKEKDPYIIIGGDFNNKKVDVISIAFPDINRIETQATRGDSHLDLCLTNLLGCKSSLLPPLTSKYGTNSDHGILRLTVPMPKSKHKYVKITRMKITERGSAEFCDLVNNFDWSIIDNYQGPDAKTEKFHEIVENFKSKCFPMKTSKIRDDEDPWVTDHLRKLMNKKRKEYGKNKKSARWYQLCELVDVRLSDAKSAYYDREVQKISCGTKNLAYNALNNLKCAERPKTWSIQDISPDKDIEEIVEEAADFFCAVSNENTPITQDDIVKTYDRPIYPITEEMLIERVKSSKKSSSMVPGDIPPKLLGSVINSISAPLCKIMNEVPVHMTWPKLWRREYQTIIPKTTNPSSWSETRNLSCTNFMSKVLESFVVDSMKSEVELSELQYGGIKGCGTDNFLCELWNNILESLEDTNNVVALMSIDFSKAFNRLSHVECVRKLAKKGASNQTIGLVYAFLQGREMQVRAGQNFSSLRKIHGGSPQGTKLGNLLFCLSIDDIMHPEDQTSDVEIQTPDSSPETSPPSAIPPEYRPIAVSTPVPKSHEDSICPNPYGVRNKINVIRDTILEEKLPDHEYDEAIVEEIGYVDDLNIVETLDTKEAGRHITQKKEKIIIRAKGCEKGYVVIKDNGTKLGLKINPDKTQLICFTAHNHVETQCCVNIEGKMVESKESLKILGFLFSNTPTVKSHIVHSVKKFNRAMWSLRHLKKARLTNNTIVKVYKSLTRPIIEYACNVYGPMLTGEMEEMLESCQKRVLRMIFGNQFEYNELLEKSGLGTLKERRRILFEKFAMKMSKSRRFSQKWLPTYDRNTGINTRDKKKYIVFFARTQRLFNSPVYTMRRVLNNMNV